MSLENLGISAKEITTLHTRATGFSTDENSNINIFESDKWVSGSDNLVNKGISTIVEFHNETLEDLLSSGQLDKVEDNLLVGSEHATLCNEVAKEATDSTSWASDSDFDGGPGVSGRGEVSADALKSFHCE